jgi:hypothetical protein
MRFSVSYRTATGDYDFQFFRTEKHAREFARFVGTFTTDVRVYAGRPGECRL